MKTTFFTLFLAFAFTLAGAEPVVDVNGNFVTNGGSYYILPSLWSAGGIGLAATGDETCPLTVIQTVSELSKGVPFTISASNRITFITTGVTLDISATKPPNCADTGRWTILSGDRVKLAGFDDKRDGWFRIQKSGGFAYKLVFCGSEGSCADIGTTYSETAGRPLVVTGSNPLQVVFVRAESESSDSAA